MLFPTLQRRPEHEYEVVHKWNTIITPLSAGRENRTRTYSFPLRTITMPLFDTTTSDANLIINFFNNECFGAFNSFRLVFPYIRTYTKEYIDTADGVDTTWDLPCKDGDEITTYVYKDNVTEEFTFGDGTGSDGLDQIILSTPNAGCIITATFQAYFAPLVRFPDEMTEKWLWEFVYEYKQLTFIEVRE